MRTVPLVLLIVASATTAFGARQMTVEKLHSLLINQKVANVPDEKAAKQIADVQLTGRLSWDQLSQYSYELKLGPKTALSLTLISDLSAFLHTPSDQLPSTSPPDLAARKAMVGAAYRYVAGIMRRLPDFLATKTTSSFDDSPQVPIEFGVAPLRGGLRYADTIVQEITFHDGRELLRELTPVPGSKTGRAPALKGLSSWGEFGTLEAIILSDSSSAGLEWSHWERSALGIVGVFTFRVPQGASHYLVDYCCVRKSGGPDVDHPYIQRTGVANSYKARPAYHGTLSIEPKTGAILRITLQSELNKSDPITRNDVVVEFAAVGIGDGSYICPIRSVAISSTLVGSESSSAEWEVLRVNDTTFTNYHRFGATVRVIPGFNEPK